MAGTINGIASTFVRCEFPAGRERLDVWAIPGVPGYGVAKLGLGETEFTIVAELLDSRANVLAWYALLQALQGSIITVVNDAGATNTKVLVEKVGQLDRQAAVIPGTTTTTLGVVPIAARIMA